MEEMERLEMEGCLFGRWGNDGSAGSEGLVGSLWQPGTGLGLERATKCHMPCCVPCGGAEGLCSHRGWQERGPCRAQKPPWAGPEGTAPHLCLAGNSSAWEQGANRAKQISAPPTRMGAAQEFVI